MDIFTLSHAAAQTISEHATASEEAGRLHPEIIDLISQEKWFKLYLPKKLGGIDIKLPSILRLLEAIAMIDGSTGWTVTLCSGASWFASFLEHHPRNQIFNRPDTCITGSGAVGGTATVVPEGYLISGSWKYSSGALHATHFTANCYIRNSDGSAARDAHDREIVKSFIFDRNQVKMTPTWEYMGMVATGSHGFEVNNLFIPANRSFEINGELRTQTNAGNYPFLQLAETTLAVNFSGMALHFLETAEAAVLNSDNLKRFSEQHSEIIQETFAREKQVLSEARDKFFQIADRSWSDLQRQTLEEPVLEKVSHASKRLAHISRRVTDNLYPYCGLDAARKTTLLNRIWRDIHTASQHSLLTFER